MNNLTTYHKCLFLYTLEEKLPTIIQLIFQSTNRLPSRIQSLNRTRIQIFNVNFLIYHFYDSSVSEHLFLNYYFLFAFKLVYLLNKINNRMSQRYSVFVLL